MHIVKMKKVNCLCSEFANTHATDHKKMYLLHCKKMTTCQQQLCAATVQNIITEVICRIVVLGVINVTQLLLAQSLHAEGHFTDHKKLGLKHTELMWCSTI